MIDIYVILESQAILFSEKGLGLPRIPFEGGAAFFTLDGSWLSLYPWDTVADDATVSGDGAGFQGVTFAHVVSSIEKVVEVLNQVVRSGGKIVKPAQDVFSGGNSGYFADPDGHLWEVAWNPFWDPGPKDNEKA